MNKSSKVLLGLAACIALAAVTAFLIAPEEVKAYRKKAYKKGKKLWKNTKHAADDLVQKSAEISEEVGDAISGVKDKVVNAGKELLS